ncbi:MAG: hypothetical protein DRI34_04750 [Deltaproteobacteria bacterium]|nr:MAG: hypothetical protein DRI34_04750 [Deltaproteobacteria bacterium]
MAFARERWTRLDEGAKFELPRATRRFETVFVSPAGIFVPAELEIEPGTPVLARLSVGGKAVVAHTEMRRLLDAEQASARGIEHPQGGSELRIVRMEGDGSQVLAEHIKKVLMESGGPG